MKSLKKLFVIVLTFVMSLVFVCSNASIVMAEESNTESILSTSMVMESKYRQRVA